MSKIVATLTPEADGTVRLPLPPELRHGRVEVTATLRAVGDAEARSATPETIARRKAAFGKLREMGGLRRAIPDPVAWQRDQRRERSLPGGD
jgi:hypothetical protein